MLVAPHITSCASLWEIFVALTLPIFKMTSPGVNPFEVAATLPGVTWKKRKETTDKQNKTKK